MFPKHWRQLLNGIMHFFSVWFSVNHFEADYKPLPEQLCAAVSGTYDRFVCHLATLSQSGKPKTAKR